MKLIAKFFVVSTLLLGAELRSEDEFPKLYNSESAVEAVPLPAEVAAKSMQVPGGFRVQVFASEPDIQNPIAMSWDAQGRLWVAENYTYAERSQRFDLSLRDRVLVLEDSNGDGVADRRQVFTDQVQMLTGIEVGLGGVWLMCPPQLLFIPDRDHDARPDGPAEVVLDGFEVAKENYHNFANGLRFGPDGWLYGRCGGSCPGRIGRPNTPPSQRVALEGGIWRYSTRNGQFEVLTHGTTNPWGHDWNEFGEAFFINTVNGHLWHMIPGAHFMRPFTLDPNPYVYRLIDTHADHWHFDTTGSWTDSRDGAANQFGGGHAHVGMMIYQGDNWPEEYRGKLLTWNLHGRRANVEVLQREGSGYVGSHEGDLLTSQDPFCRGMDFVTGPGGDVFLADWSDTGECHEATGVHRTSGRIFNIRYGDVPFRDPSSFDLYSLPDAQLASLIGHRNQWFVRQARLELCRRMDKPKPSDDGHFEYVGEISRLLDSQDSAIVCQAMLTLHALGELDNANLMTQLLEHGNEHVRACAVGLLSDAWPIDDCYGPHWLSPEPAASIRVQANRILPLLTQLAEQDPSPLVRLALASTLQRLPLEYRPALAAALVARSEDQHDHNLPLLVWYGLMSSVQADPVAVASVATGECWPDTQRLIVRRIVSDPKLSAGMQPLLEGLAHVGPNSRLNLLRGFEEGLEGYRNRETPAGWESTIASVPKSETEFHRLAQQLSAVFGNQRAMREIRELVLDSSADISLRRSSLETLVQTALPETLKEICIPLLSDPRINVVAARGLVSVDDPEVAMELIKNYRRFRAPQRPQIIGMLTSRKSFAQALLLAIADNKIPVSELTAYDVRQIKLLEENELTKRVSELWGEVRDSPQDKLAKMNELRRSLEAESVGDINLGAGRALFQQTCAKCHRLYGAGETIGPDLTGGNRHDLNYLLENIIDPSAVVSKNYRMSILLLKDDRIINGLIFSQTETLVEVQTQTDRLTISHDQIEQIKETGLSPMPDGLLDNMTNEQIRDLLAYLRHPTQVSLP
ncbi:MAG: hypothetical protein KDB03_16080 [Planctomycetales bacterium]|nr:hypothetical protein [Planctomycetales bacterium]